ncbi:MAG: DNA polymerase III subunit delta [Lachnospiraceae bacterium]|nr:DNA polymerase III subunit delta [Lachnospiraceae bacterium]
MAQGKEKANGMSIINTHIKSGEFSNLYLLYGTEEYLVSQYKDNLVKALVDTEDSMNYSVFKTENAKADAIIDIASTMPFFADRRVVLVEDSDFFKNGNEDMEKFFSTIPESTVLIFVEHNVDGRCKIFKTISSKGTVAIFDAQDEKTLAVWIKSLFTRENMQIEDKAVFRLIECVGTDMNTLANESEKLKCYALEKGVVVTEDVDVLCVNQIEGKIFDMMDALSKRDKKTTISLYDDLVQLREPAMRLLYLITRQFNILLKTKLAIETGVDSSRIASVVKVPPFTVKKYISMCNGYTYNQLVEKVNMCQETDTKIKTGVMRDNLAVEMLIVELLQ